MNGLFAIHIVSNWAVLKTKIMNNKEFILLSEKEVKNLNGSKHEESNEAWRSGYNYLVNKIRESMQNDYNEEFMTKMEEIAESELEEFKFNVEM